MLEPVPTQTLPAGLRYTLVNGPWVLIGSLSFGLSNYLIILVLAFQYGLAEAGKFRLFLSIVELLAIFSLLDTSKIIVKNLVLGKRGVVRPLMLHRAKWSLAGLAIGCIIAAVFYQQGSDIWIPLLVASLLLPAACSADAYSDINLAKKQFQTNAFFNLAKFGTLTLAALTVAHLDVGVFYFMVAYFVIVAAFHLAFVTRYEEAFEPAGPEAGVLKKQATRLSGAGLFPALLEQADKALISLFLGMDALGLYTVGVATGRLLLHCIRPLLTIYFPMLVHDRPTPKLLLVLGCGLTVVGAAFAWLLQFYFDRVLGPSFAGAFPVAAVCAAGLGVYGVGVTTYYSTIFHRNSDLRIPTLTNIVTAAVTLCYLVAAVIFGGQWALLLCAASYPLRELINLTIITVLSKRVGANAKAGSVL